jgi:hypothetical protein
MCDNNNSNKVGQTLLVGITDGQTSFVSVNPEGISFTVSGTSMSPCKKEDGS